MLSGWGSMSLEVSVPGSEISSEWALDRDDFVAVDSESSEE
jgi:hypothetical protein